LNQFLGALSDANPYQKLIDKLKKDFKELSQDGV
jgi:hypothetical protein